MTKKLLLLLVLLSVTLLASSCKVARVFCRHNLTDVVFSPTCTEEGYTEHTCSKCGKSFSDTKVPTLPHTYTSAVTAPNCTAEGYTTYTCTVCSHQYTDNIVAKSSHRFNDGPCTYCGAEEITENITANTDWFNEEVRTFEINTKEELAGLSSLVNSGMISADVVIYLNADIDLGFNEWIPIGTAENPFAATFKGEGYTISSLKISNDQDYVGLFGNVTGTISDFNVVNASVYVRNSYSYVGTACGYSKNAIKNITASGFVDAKRSSYVGGVAGALSDLADNVQSSVSVAGTDYVGGIAGMATPASAVFSKLTNTGSISGEICVGGIFGQFNSTGSMQTDYITNTGDVTGKIQVGGVFGYANGNNGSVIYSASVKANITGEYYVGGIIGRTETITIRNCTNEGSTVSATSYLTNESNFYVWLGGYVGSGYEVVDCVNTVAINYNSRGSYIGGIAGYLSYGATNCENTASVVGCSDVGGVIGYLHAAANTTTSKLKNSGAVSGVSAVGGIIGKYDSVSTSTLSAIENSGSVTASGNAIGGIVGYLNCTSNTFTAADLKNTGNVSAEKYEVGGIFGYAFANQANSIVKHCTSSANITGTETVGGLVGRTNLELKDCSNEGTTVTATNWHTDGGTDYVWLGGYVGDGYKVTGAVNNSDITYTGTGIYVGGIMGYGYQISDCTNNGNISSTSSYVGGIAGKMWAVGDMTYANLTNNGAITGADRVGGIFGQLEQQENRAGSRNNIDKHVEYFTVTLNNLSNTGKVNASGAYSGGITGYCYLINHGSRSLYCCSSWSYKCTRAGGSLLYATNLSNTAEVSGKSSAGEMFGYFWCDHNSTKSTLDGYTYLGKVSVNGEEVETANIVGEGTLLNFTNGTVYGAEDTEEGTDATE